MNSICEKKHVLQLSPIIWVIVVMMVYSLLFFYNTIRPDWVVTGDTLNGLARYSYQYSGFARGEYPMWNPLVRAGQPEELAQVFHLANPVSNLVMGISVVIGVEDVIVSYSIHVFLSRIIIRNWDLYGDVLLDW